ncbi:hypothetical protein [Bacteroides pyogenes]|uniref:hypothetical protein n=1 Tax=Bacteroides pyogenes TaxID=310300 RepID=UPI002FDAC996
MELIEIVDKLVGNIEPFGSESIDEVRFENLKVYCELIEKMIIKVDNIAYENKDDTSSSVKKSVDYISDFFTNRLKIEE